MSHEPVQGSEPERYGFWPYDLFPGLLSGRVLKGPHANGKCHVEGFDGFSFTCVAIVSGTQGRVLHEKLLVARKAYEQSVRATEAAWRELAERLTAEIKAADGG